MGQHDILHTWYLAKSTVTLGEVIHGAEKSTESVRNLADVENRTRSSGRNIQTICRPIACPGKTHVAHHFLMNKRENRVALGGFSIILFGLLCHAGDSSVQGFLMPEDAI
jgi:hypothetical protein